MEKSLKQKNVYMTAILLFLFTYCFLVVLNAVFHVQSDDLGKPLRGLQSAVNQYMHWNGRLGELISVTYGSWFASTPFFALVNSIIGACFIFLIFVHKVYVSWDDKRAKSSNPFKSYSVKWYKEYKKYAERKVHFGYSISDSKRLNYSYY